MKPSKQALTLPQAKAIREIEQRLAELERMRQRLERQMGNEAEATPVARKGAKAAH